MSDEKRIYVAERLSQEKTKIKSFIFENGYGSEEKSKAFHNNSNELPLD